jgi:hypothetical protein
MTTKNDNQRGNPSRSIDGLVSCEELDREVLTVIKNWSGPMRAKSVYLKLRRMFPNTKTSEITASLERISS